MSIIDKINEILCGSGNYYYTYDRDEHYYIAHLIVEKLNETDKSKRSISKAIEEIMFLCFGHRINADYNSVNKIFKLYYINN